MTRTCCSGSDEAGTESGDEYTVLGGIKFGGWGLTAIELELDLLVPRV